MSRWWLGTAEQHDLAPDQQFLPYLLGQVIDRPHKPPLDGEGSVLVHHADLGQDVLDWSRGDTDAGQPGDVGGADRRSWGVPGGEQDAYPAAEAFDQVCLPAAPGGVLVDRGCQNRPQLGVCGREAAIHSRGQVPLRIEQDQLPVAEWQRYRSVLLHGNRFSPRRPPRCRSAADEHIGEKQLLPIPVGTEVVQWLVVADRAKATPPIPASASVEDEMRQLRKRVAELELEKEILRKAAAYFAKEMGR